MTGAWQGGSKPCAQDEHDAWLADIRHRRHERRIRIGYDASRYDLPALKWTQSSFFQPQMMVEDRYFYDPVAHKYTVDRYLDDVEKRYSGIDAVLIWPTYPNMGIDPRYSSCGVSPAICPCPPWARTDTPEGVSAPAFHERLAT